MSDPITELIENRHIQAEARRLHTLLQAANGTRFNDTLEETTRELALTVLSLRIHPDQRVATGGDFLLVRSSIETEHGPNYHVAVIAGEVNSFQLWAMSHLG